MGWFVLYRGGKELNQVGREKIIKVEKLKEELAELKETVHLVGDLPTSCCEQLKSAGDRFYFVTELFNLPRGGAVAQLAYNYLSAQESDQLMGLTPSYLKRSQAEIQREQNSN